MPRLTPLQDDRLQPADALSAPLAALSSFQQATQQADSKAATLAAVQVGLTAVLATRAGELGSLDHRSAFGLSCWMLGGVYLLAFLVCGFHLVQALRPRWAKTSSANAFALSADDVHRAARLRSPRRTAGARQLWEAADGVAVIAVRKLRHLVHGILWTAVLVVSGSAWLVLTTLRTT